MKRFISLNDILFVSLLSIIFIIWIIFNPFHSGNKKSLIIKSADNTDKLIDLNKNDFYKIKGPLGITEIEVKDKKVRVISSPCPGKICLKNGWIKNTGDSIYCLPNKVIAVISGKSPDLDARSF